MSRPMVPGSANSADDMPLTSLASRAAPACTSSTSPKFDTSIIARASRCRTDRATGGPTWARRSPATAAIDRIRSSFASVAASAVVTPTTPTTRSPARSSHARCVTARSSSRATGELAGPERLPEEPLADRDAVEQRGPPVLRSAAEQPVALEVHGRAVAVPGQLDGDLGRDLVAVAHLLEPLARRRAAGRGPAAGVDGRRRVRIQSIVGRPNSGPRASVHAEVAQLVGLLVALDALGDEVDALVLGERHVGGDDRPARGLVHDVVDERRVELDERGPDPSDHRQAHAGRVLDATGARRRWPGRPARSPSSLRRSISEPRTSTTMRAGRLSACSIRRASPTRSALTWTKTRPSSGGTPAAAMAASAARPASGASSFQCWGWSLPSDRRARCERSTMGWNAGAAEPGAGRTGPSPASRRPARSSSRHPFTIRTPTGRTP